MNTEMGEAESRHENSSMGKAKMESKFQAAMEQIQ
jgi:hypothetical protein